MIEQISNARNNEIRKAKTEIPSMLERYNDQDLSESQEQKLSILKGYYNDLMKIDEILEDMVRRIEDIKGTSQLYDIEAGN